MHAQSFLLTAAFLSGIGAYVPQPQKSTVANVSHQVHSRRDTFKKLALLAPMSIVANPSKSDALEQCRAKSHNCIRTTWVAPTSLSANEAMASIREVITTYPQTGQAGVDCNGWEITTDSLENDGKISLEFKSCVGPAALAINLGQPFIDDLKFELGKDASGRVMVEVKSNSRVGGSDLFVNRKRLVFLGDKLRQKGWEIPPPKYVYEM